LRPEREDTMRLNIGKEVAALQSSDSEVPTKDVHEASPCRPGERTPLFDPLDYVKLAR
jgi:hypothetical protein